MDTLLSFFHFVQHWAPLFIFGAVIIALVTEVVEQALAATIGAIAMVLFGYVSPDAALEAIAFDTLLLIMSMMILVGILQKAGLFNVISLRIANWTSGNPLLIFVFFTIATVLFASFLGGVATILIVLPIVLSLLRQMNIEPLPYIIAIIMCTNIGASTTVIGDPTNSLIAGATGFSFNSFIAFMSVPALIVFGVVAAAMMLIFWPTLRPINYSFTKLTMAHLTIEKINFELSQLRMDKVFLWGSTALLAATAIAFLTSDFTGLHPATIAAVSATLGLALFSRHLHYHHQISALDWPTLIFFTGLFVMVDGVEGTHLFDAMPDLLMTYASSFYILVVAIIWSIALVSMFFDNIPFILIMIPVVAALEAKLKAEGSDANTELLWRAIAIGGIYGGNGTIIAGVQNIVGINIAAQYGYRVSFMRYFVYGFPITLVALSAVCAYLFFIA